MLKKVKDLFWKATGMQNVARLVEEQNGFLANMAWRGLLAEAKYADPRRLSRFGFKVYSQAEEDGIIHEIFRRIGAASKTFVEIGVSHGRENNTLYLLRQGWRGVWIDGSQEYAREIEAGFASKIKSGALVMSCQYVTRENVDELLGNLVQQQEIDLLSIDVDGNDYHILRALGAISPRVIVLEYNPVFAPPIEWVMPYDPQHLWDGSDHYSASLKSYELMLAEKGYALVGCSTNGNNAFFVKTALVSDLFCADTSAEFHYEPQRFWLTKGFMAGHCFRDRPTV